MQNIYHCSIIDIRSRIFIHIKLVIKVDNAFDFQRFVVHTVCTGYIVPWIWQFNSIQSIHPSVHLDRSDMPFDPFIIRLTAKRKATKNALSQNLTFCSAIGKVNGINRGQFFYSIRFVFGLFRIFGKIVRKLCWSIVIFFPPNFCFLFFYSHSDLDNFCQNKPDWMVNDEMTIRIQDI